MNILAISAHLDDLELGCYNTIKMHLDKGDNVYVHIMTNSVYGVSLTGHSRNHKNVAEEAQRIYSDLGIDYEIEDTIYPLSLDDEYKLRNSLIQKLEQKTIEKKINRVYYHTEFDLNTDHTCTNQICRVAFRNIIEQFEYASNWYGSEKFIPNVYHFYNESELNNKLDILKIFKSEYGYRNNRWKSEIVGRESNWGQRFGKEYAEGFIGRITI